MGGQTTKQRPEPVAGLQEDSCLSVIPVFRTSIRVSIYNILETILHKLIR